jgi:hypothetical protein
VAIDRRRLVYALDKAYGGSMKRPRTLRCERCKNKIKVEPRGRLPRFCSQTCRQRAYERAKWGQPHLAALHSDLATVEMRTAIREEAWAMLRQAGLVQASTPPPMPRRKPRPDLRLVTLEDDGA